MWTKFDECDCTMDYCGKNNKIEGTPTKMTHLGKGKFICPVCKQEQDRSEYTFKIIVNVEYEEDCKVLTVIGGEDRIFKHWNDDDKCCIIKDCIQEDLGEYSDEFYDDWLDKHDAGIYELIIYYEPLTFSTQDGTDYDLATQIFEEIKVGESAKDKEDKDILYVMNETKRIRLAVDEVIETLYKTELIGASEKRKLREKLYGY